MRERGADVVDDAAEGDREPGRGRLRGAPGAEREAAVLGLGERHRGGERAVREQAAAEADQRDADGRTAVPSRAGAEKITQANATTPTSAPKPATRCGSAPRASRRAASTRPAPPPSASIAVSAVVTPTGR